MLKRIYCKDKEKADNKITLTCPDLVEFKDYLKCIIPGSKIKWVGEKRRYTCIARSDNFIIVNKPFNLRKDYDGKKLVQYSIFDLQQMKCNHDNLVFGIFDYNDLDDCKTALEWLERSLEPFESKYDVVDGKCIPKYNEAGDTLEISQRGWANIEDIVDEIWVEATYCG